MDFRGFTPAFQGANSVTSALADRHQAQQQQQAQAALVKILAQMSAPAGGAPASPQVPGAPPPGGVSPSMGGMPPAGGAPGGAGPISPMGGASPSMPGSSMPPGMDYGRLAAAIQGSGIPAGAQGLALQMLMKGMQPGQNNATKLEIADKRADTARDNRTSRETIADKTISSREKVAEANRIMRTNTNAKLKDDPTYRALESRLKAAQSANASNGTADTYTALQKASDELYEYAQKLKAPGAPPSVSAPAPGAGGDTRISVVDAKGNEFTVPESQLNDAIAQGYKKK